MIKFFTQIFGRRHVQPGQPIPGVAVVKKGTSQETAPSFPNQDFARKAVRFERRIELGMEGHRLFDLMRWEVLSETIKAYFPNEERTIPNINTGALAQPKHLVFPIPLDAIDLSRGVLKQNPEWQ